MTGPGDLLGQRALNRATLARQLLLRRWDLPATAAVERLGGLNGQDFEPPYIGLWTRLAGFEHQALTRALEDRSVVRGSLLRATQHLVTAADYLAWQPLLQPVLERSRRTFAWGTAEVDLDELAWGVRGPTPFVLAESWLGRSLAPPPPRRT